LFIIGNNQSDSSGFLAESCSSNEYYNQTKTWKYQIFDFRLIPLNMVYFGFYAMFVRNISQPVNCSTIWHVTHFAPNSQFMTIL